MTPDEAKKPQFAENRTAQRLRNAPAIDRLMFRTRQEDSGCWTWMGSKNTKGYGHMRSDMGGPLISVHRLSWAYFHGEIPAELEVDHLCRNRACVNPQHLELVTRRENVLRGMHNQNHGKRACVRGHAFDAENTSIDKLGKRVCKTCVRERMRMYRARSVS